MRRRPPVSGGGTTLAVSVVTLCRRPAGLRRPGLPSRSVKGRIGLKLKGLLSIRGVREARCASTDDGRLPCRYLWGRYWPFRPTPSSLSPPRRIPRRQLRQSPRRPKSPQSPKPAAKPAEAAPQSPPSPPRLRRARKTRGGGPGKARHAAQCRRREADLARPVRRVGRLYGFARRQEGLLRHRQADIVPDQSARPAAQSDLHVRLLAPGREGQNEVSIIIGYPFKPAPRPPPQSARAYSCIPSRRRLDQERSRRNPDGRRHARGPDRVVKGMSAKGTQTTETYSLKGLPQALDRVGQECK